jgi:hypothetical protein
MTSTAALKSISKDDEKWRQHQEQLRLLGGWDTEQWATALEWYQPHTGIAPTKLEDVRTIQAAYVNRFGRAPLKVASSMFGYIEMGEKYLFKPWHNRP